MPVCVPIRDVKDTTKFMEMLDGAGSPVTVTRNGYEAFVAMTPEIYNGMRLAAAKAELYGRLATAERQRRSGEVVDGEDFLEGLLHHHGR